MNIYTSLEKPIYSLAPMEDVTDTVFRQIITVIKRPDLFYTEFVNVDGLFSVGRDKVMNRLKFLPIEKPLIVQLWGSNPDNFYYATRMVKDMGFDGVDINMGCSVSKVTNKGAGAGLINADRGLVKDIVSAVKDGAGDLPISVKTRVGWLNYDLDWIRFLLEQDLDVLTIHGRTATGVYSKKPNWGRIRASVEIRDELGKKTLIFGNGGVITLKQAKRYLKKCNVDGIMIGKEAIHNPWIFSGRQVVPVSESFETFKKHIVLFKDTWGDSKDFNTLKKFVGSYVNGFVGSQDIRNEMMKTTTIEELLEQVEKLIK